LKEYLTMNDIELKGKTVLVRLDLNSPIKNGNILDDKRFRSHIPTLIELNDSKAVLISHQGRAGGKDFTTMEAHAKKLSKLLKKDVRYVDDIFGSCAKKAIKGMKKGDIVLLENLRFYSEESLKRSPKEHANTHLVKKLGSVADLFINDAFSTSHRSHLSMVGFSTVLPSVAGRLMEKEIEALNKALNNPSRPCVFVLGGAKVDDSIEITKNILEKKIADKVLLTGLVANVFLLASEIDIGKPSVDFIEKEGYLDQVDIAKDLLGRFKNIMLPTDAALNVDGKRVEKTLLDSAEPIDFPIHDMGKETILAFSKEIKNSGVAVLNGPAGVFENEAFSKGTFEILRAAGESEFGIIGGGHITAALSGLGIEEKMGHISTGGGACISFLSGKELPGIEALTEPHKHLAQKHKP